MFRRYAGAWLVGLGLLACSPTLNWRVVNWPQAQVRALLPCKPEQAQREVSLAGQPVVLVLQGCEAGGALFAVTVTDVTAPEHAAPLMAEWQRAVVARWQGTPTGPVRPWMPKGAMSVPGAGRMVLQARGPDGKPAVAHAGWLLRARGAQLQMVHALVVTDGAMPEEAMAPMFEELELL